MTKPKEHPWFVFTIGGVGGKIEYTHVRRNEAGLLNQNLSSLAIPGHQAMDFVDWLRAPRPLTPGDFITIKAGRYSKDVAEVLAVVDDRVWVNLVWKTSSEQAIISVSDVDAIIDEQEAVRRGFRLPLRKLNKE